MLPASMKRFEVTMVVACAARQAAAMFTAPVEKFSIAGTRPKACRPKNVSRQPMEFGSSTATLVWPGVISAMRRPRMKLPITSLSRLVGLRAMSSTTLWPPPWIWRASRSDWNSVRSMAEVRNTMSVITS